MSDTPKVSRFYIQDPFTAEVRGPLNSSDLKRLFSQGGFEHWGVSMSPTGPWTPASEVKGLKHIARPPGAAIGEKTVGASNSPASSANPVGSSGLKQATDSPPAFRGHLQKFSPGQAGWLERLKKNPFLVVIGSGILLFVLGVANGNEVIGGAGLWTAILGVVLPRLYSKYPNAFAAVSPLWADAAPLSVGALVALAIGTLVLLASMAADTTVESGFGRVHNIGLMNQQRNGVTLGAILMVAGVAMGGLHLHKRAAGSVSQDTGERNCPMCGETIKKAAVLCKHCKSDIS